MKKHDSYFRRIATSVLLLASTLSHGQILIEADTTSFDCRDAFARRIKEDTFAISSYDDMSSQNLSMVTINACRL